jgi:hypothetical protein
MSVLTINILVGALCVSLYILWFCMLYVNGKRRKNKKGRRGVIA